eukprot:GHVU01150767.1.p1 GENE.GHVU01150767.1~~GHVU01150767.1.p1  ORF type:complete len:312 (+),score=35.65 GHVU01150767.1:398-1333(+)
MARYTVLFLMLAASGLPGAFGIQKRNEQVTTGSKKASSSESSGTGVMQRSGFNPNLDSVDSVDSAGSTDANDAEENVVGIRLIADDIRSFVMHRASGEDGFHSLLEITTDDTKVYESRIVRPPRDVLHFATKWGAKVQGVSPRSLSIGDHIKLVVGPERKASGRHYVEIFFNDDKDGDEIVEMDSNQRTFTLYYDRVKLDWKPVVDFKFPGAYDVEWTGGGTDNKGQSFRVVPNKVEYGYFPNNKKEIEFLTIEQVEQEGADNWIYNGKRVTSEFIGIYNVQVIAYETLSLSLHQKSRSTMSSFIKRMESN